MGFPLVYDDGAFGIGDIKFIPFNVYAHWSVILTTEAIEGEPTIDVLD